MNRMDPSSAIHSQHHREEEVEVVDGPINAFSILGPFLSFFFVGCASGSDPFEVIGSDVFALDLSSDSPFANVIGAESFAFVGSIEGVDPTWEWSRS